MAVVLIGLAPVADAADIRFGSTERVFTMDQTGHDIVARFPFTNAGDAMARVHVAKPTCDCVSVSIDDFRYAPGVDGTIVVVLSITPGPTTQQRTVRVMVDDDDGGDPHHFQLVVRVEADRPRPAGSVATETPMPDEPSSRVGFESIGLVVDALRHLAARASALGQQGAMARAP